MIKENWKYFKAFKIKIVLLSSLIILLVILISCSKSNKPVDCKEDEACFKFHLRECSPAFVTGEGLYYEVVSPEKYGLCTVKVKVIKAPLEKAHLEGKEMTCSIDASKGMTESFDTAECFGELYDLTQKPKR